MHASTVHPEIAGCDGLSQRGHRTSGSWYEDVRLPVDVETVIRLLDLIERGWRQQIDRELENLVAEVWLGYAPQMRAALLTRQ